MSDKAIETALALTLDEEKAKPSDADCLFIIYLKENPTFDPETDPIADKYAYRFSGYLPREPQEQEELLCALSQFFSSVELRDEIMAELAANRRPQSS